MLSLLGGAAKLVLGRAPGRLGAAFGDDGSGGLLSGAPAGAGATIEEARFAQHQLSQRLFGADDVPWWLIGVGIGGSALVASQPPRPRGRSPRAGY